jgi:hypothetical protein
METIRTARLVFAFAMSAMPFCAAQTAPGQEQSPAANAGAPPSASERLFSNRNTWSVFGMFSPDSSHIFLGIVEQRRLVILGGEYTRRVHLGRRLAVYYLAQVRPVILESDPVLLAFQDINTGQLLFPLAKPLRVEIVDYTPIAVPQTNIVVKRFYGREWTYGGGLSPLGIKLNLATRHRLQPVIIGAAGFVVSTRDIPEDHASSFNFTFEFGAGLEWFYRPKRSLRFDYRIHHISSAEIGTQNPGIDSGIFQATYSFGK